MHDVGGSLIADQIFVVSRVEDTHCLIVRRDLRSISIGDDFSEIRKNPSSRSIVPLDVTASSAGAGGDEETLPEVASEATEDGTSTVSTATAHSIKTVYTPKKEASKTADSDDKDEDERPAAIETDAFGDAGEEAKEKTGGDGGVVVKCDDADDQLDVKVEDLDEVLKELMLYADMASRDCQPFLTRHAYVHR